MFFPQSLRLLFFFVFWRFALRGHNHKALCVKQHIDSVVITWHLKWTYIYIKVHLNCSVSQTVSQNNHFGKTSPPLSLYHSLFRLQTPLPSQGPQLANGGAIWEEDQDPRRTNTHTNTDKHTREHQRVNKSEKNERVRQSDTLTPPLIRLRCVGPGQRECLPCTHCGSFQSAFNPIIKLVMLPWTQAARWRMCSRWSGQQ